MRLLILALAIASRLIAVTAVSRRSVSSVTTFLSNETSENVTADYKYGLVLDAGSSRSTVHIFRWTVQQDLDLVELTPTESDEQKLSTNVTLASFADSPEEAGPALSTIIKAALLYVPEAVRSESPLFVKATAGMRLLEPERAAAVLEELRQHLSQPANCPFKFVNAEIISGEEEAVFAYITANFYLHKLKEPGAQTFGTLEMGGASMQVAFKPSADIQDHEFQFYINRKRQSVYAKSYIRFGADEALARFLERLAKAAEPNATEVRSPCHNPGYNRAYTSNGHNLRIIGTGNTSDCIPLVQKMLGVDVECLMPPCALLGNYMPKVSGRFYATAGFFYTVSGLGLVGWNEAKALSIAEITKASRKFCESDLSIAQNPTNAPVTFMERYCFLATYQTQIFTAFGFDLEDTSVTYSRTGAGRSLTWTTGAMLYETQLMPLRLGGPVLTPVPPSTEELSRDDFSTSFTEFLNGKYFYVAIAIIVPVLAGIFIVLFLYPQADVGWSSRV